MVYRRGEGFPWGPLLRGWRKQCPNCGHEPLFETYLEQMKTCNQCGEHLGKIRTDDIAPYFTIIIVGHLVVPSLLMLEQQYHPEQWVHFAIWPVLTLILMFYFLPRVKGALLGLMWHLRLRGDEHH